MDFEHNHLKGSNSMAADFLSLSTGAFLSITLISNNATILTVLLRRYSATVLIMLDCSSNMSHRLHNANVRLLPNLSTLTCSSQTQVIWIPWLSILAVGTSTSIA